MATLTSPVRLPVRRFGETARRDVWWIQPLLVFLGLSTFLIYATWAAFQGDHYTYGPYLSPFYSPELFGASPHRWFGLKPSVWPASIGFSPALLILPIPASFRLTCYYYRGAYYKAFWGDPPSCTVGEPRSRYWGSVLCRLAATCSSGVGCVRGSTAYLARPRFISTRPQRGARCVCGRVVGRPRVRVARRPGAAFDGRNFLSLRLPQHRRLRDL